MGNGIRSLKAILVDASEARAAALRASLEEQFSPVTLEPVASADGLASALMRRGWDVVLYSGEGADPVPPRKARALVRLADPHLPFLSVSPSVRANDLLAVVSGFDADVVVVSDPTRVPEAIRAEMTGADQRRHEGGAHRLLTAQQAITDHMASAPEPGDLLERSLGSLGETLGWTYGELWRPADGALVCTSAWTAEDAGDAIRDLATDARGASVVPGRGLAGRVFAFRHQEWAADLTAGDGSGATVDAGLVSGVAFPIFAGERCDGVIALYDRDRREQDPSSAAMLAAVGGQLGRYVEGRRGMGAVEPLRFLEVAGTMILVLDTAGRITRINLRGCDILGRPEAELLGQDWFELAVPEDERTERRSAFARLLAGDGGDVEPSLEENNVVTASGETRTIAWHATVLRTDDGTLMGALASGSDVTDTRRTEQQAEFLAYHDPVTGLPNRTLLEEHLRLALARTRRTGASVALLHIDLDNFKLVNDSLGHGAGDELLCALSVRLQQMVRATDLLARVGGDEFLLLLADVVEDPLLVTERVTEQVLEALAEPFDIAGAEFQVSASIGVSVSPHDAHDAETLLAHADAAMYQAKQVARGGWTLYNRDAADPLARLNLTAGLRRALREDEFQLHYQPIFDLESGLVVGVEALIRWLNPAHGMVSPSEFVSVAEETGLIDELGDWVVRAVCEQQVEWASRGLYPHISFNVSPRQLKRLDFAPRVAMHLQETGADARRLTVELTESSTLQDHLLTEPILRQLHDMGLNIALDDFGSGYSSLSRLADMPVETLKIDRAFLREVPASREATAVVTAILRLSRALGRTAVAEGVETEEQRRFLEAQRCPLAQGFLFGRPLPPDELEELMARAAPAA